ncbi:hypothetical protein [endosymbiont of Ridgeia piscesae]|jgi:hypothetical protein|uniref:Uncharacterized protein n=1 Tax=endosymbiont of Ridgeia piscesae TaxID=54398 RepID=A0A0T5Z791_9GAMM|nr:hypothetical protein [endosymbiont of Ridgeia piscesae]KRT56445.1 hypothetical protein Ga0074115_1474 [endosymbiont of Ridgeia piscesae]KRT58788.1 hypothetical protein Ga0076813_14226 [endosymbiont of Ridgeia piscesae]
MAEYSDFTNLINAFNLTGKLINTSAVPGINLEMDYGENYIVTYTYFRSYFDITSANYYDGNDVEPTYIVDGGEYRQDIETAINSILNPAGNYSVLFSDVANIDFQEAN